MTHSIRLSSTELLLVIKALRMNSLKHFSDKEMARNLADKLMELGCSNVELANLERQKMNKIIAVDFDGTLFTNAWPNVGEPIVETINALKNEQAAGAEVILWTNRVGDKLIEALDACTKQGIIFDAVNENLPHMVQFFGGDPRKVFANEYWDDRAITATSNGLDRPRFKSKELNQLVKSLDAAGIRWNDRSDIPDAMAIERVRFRNRGHVYSVVCGHGTYGSSEGLLELWEMGGGDPSGWLTAEDVLREAHIK